MDASERPSLGAVLALPAPNGPECAAKSAHQHIMCLWKLHNNRRRDLLQRYQCLQQLQCQRLYWGSQDEINKISSRNIHYLVEQMTHSARNHFVQWLLDVCDENQRQQIIERITSEHVDLVWILRHPYGLAFLSLFISNSFVIVQLIIIVLLNFSSQPQEFCLSRGH
jgi:hypothetical protein